MNYLVFVYFGSFLCSFLYVNADQTSLCDHEWEKFESGVSVEWTSGSFITEIYFVGVTKVYLDECPIRIHSSISIIIS